MSQTAIPFSFEKYLQDKLAANAPVAMNRIVLANIPNLNPNATIDRAEGLPPAEQIVHEQDVDQVGKVNGNALAYSIVMDTSVGNFSFNAMFLIDKDDRNAVGMIVHKELEDKIAINEGTGTQGNSVVKSMLMEYDGAATAANVHVDAATWQIDYSARLNGIDEDHRLACFDTYGHTSFVGGFDVIQQADPDKYKITSGVVYIGGIRSVLDADVLQTITTKPGGIYLDVHRAGTVLSAWGNLLTITVSETELTDYVDLNGKQHYVAKLAMINANGSVTDARVNNTFLQYGLGSESPPRLNSYDATNKANGSWFRTDATTLGKGPLAGVNGVVHFERWGENDLIMRFWPATIHSSVIYLRRWKKGLGFSEWQKTFTSENLKFATEIEANAGEGDEKIMTPPLVHQAFNQYGIGTISPPILDSFNAIDKPNGSSFRTDATTKGDTPTPGLNGVVRYERWGDNDFIMHYWVASHPTAVSWVRRWKVSTGFTRWEQVFTTENLTPYESYSLFNSDSGVGDGTTIDWSSSGKQINDFKSIIVAGYWIDSVGKKHIISAIIPADIAVTITGSSMGLHVGGFTAKGSSSCDIRVLLTNITQSQATVAVLAQAYTGAVTRIDGVLY